MPSDIRSFFGGKPPGTKAEQPPPKEKKPTGRKGTKRVVEDSDDDVVPVKQTTPKKTTSRMAKKESPKGEETTASEFFADDKSSKPARTSATRTSKPETPKKATPKKVVKAAAKKEDVIMLDDDDDEGADGIHAADIKKPGRKDDDYEEITSDEEDVVKPTRVTSRAKPASRSKNEDVEMEDEDFDDFIVPDDEIKTSKVRSISQPSPKNKRKSTALDDDNDDEEDVKPAKKAPARKPPAKKAKKEPEAENAAYKAILDAIPTVRPPTPPPKDETVKFDWKSGPKNAGPPPAAGSKEIPEGEEGCLTGLKFVTTGQLSSISRDEAQELIKRYGGIITGAPSKATSYVVLGADAGPSKLRKIAELSIKTIDEDGLFALIKNLPAQGGSGVAAQKAAEKKKKDAEEARLLAMQMEKEEKQKLIDERKAAEKAAAARGLAPPPIPTANSSNTELWTKKYAPTQLNQICGNKGQVTKIQNWLDKWHMNRKRKFLVRGADGTGAERAIIIHGPPGIGKTTAAHLAAKLAGFDVIESNASDTRSKRLVETGLGDVLNNTSLMGFFEVNGKDEDLTKKKIVLVLDEVDGMSAGDRGGVGALAKLCKITSIPLILICNDRKLPKMKPFDFVTYDMPFQRPKVNEIRSRVATICAREKLNLNPQVMDALIEGSNKDIRQIVNMLATAKLDQKAMDLDNTKQMSKAWEKHVVLKPWDLCHKLLGSGLFLPTSKATLNDKIELYFNDHEFVPLMIQENYLSTLPTKANINGSDKQRKLKALQLAEEAAAAISDGDLVDRMIHGSQQQWSLMPTHAVFSTIKPASIISGAMKGQTKFTAWLGNNSKKGKLERYVKELQSHMRLRTSGDRHEIRQQYLPVLWEKTISRLAKDGKESASDVIDLMDSYFLTRDDFDFIMELGLGPQREEDVNIETQTKATFTRLYNSQAHPMPFMKASNAGAAPLKAAKKEQPDLEEAIEEEDEGDAVVEEKPDEEEDLEKALKNDKFLAKPKKKKASAAAPKKKAAASKKGKGNAAVEDGDEASEEDVKPTKKKAAPRKKAPAKK